jgi:protein-S-isoprenylcysteine O-methyltransferase Ste14
MQLFPTPTLGLLNGWIFLLVFGIVFGGVVGSFPRHVIARLYDTSNWTPAQRALTRVGKALFVAVFVFVALTPLRPDAPHFWLGSVVFVLGLIGMVIALLDFRRAAADRPVTRGLYRISRNPQWVALVLVFLGACIAVGSWTALTLTALAAVSLHFRILAEERSCLTQYGESYRAFMQRVPRYFWLL